MKKLLLIIVSLVFSSCISTAKLVNVAEKLNTSNAYVLCNLTMLKNDSLNSMGISLINVDTKKEIIFKTEGVGVLSKQLAAVAPGNYRLYRWVVTSAFNDEAGSRVFAPSQESNFKTIRIEAGSIVYVGDFTTRIDTVVFNTSWNYQLVSILNNFENAKNELISQYPDSQKLIIKNIYTDF